MTEKISVKQLHGVASVVAPPARTKVDRSFGLPTGLYAATVILYLGFLAVMTASFMNPGLAIPMAIIAGIVVTGFAVPSVWVRMKPDNDRAAPTWGQFASKGIETLSGRLTAGQAAAQVLILPSLILVWGLTIAVIAAVVR